MTRDELQAAKKAALAEADAMATKIVERGTPDSLSILADDLSKLRARVTSLEFLEFRASAQEKP